MPERPSGTVTFLFTDVERSTALLAEVGADAFAVELARHRRLLRRAWQRHEGVEIDTQGDSFFVAFARAGQAVAAAREAQASVEELSVRVRIGVHTGEPLLTDSGYVGMDVHRAARIAAAGHGGQVLLSQATRDLILDEDVVDLGEHRLRDLTRPERLYQLGQETFAPLRSLNRLNLPEAAHPLVGRTVERRELAALLRQSRLVTITGAGGTGKTRLALHLAAELADEFPDGVHFVSLASLSDPGLVLMIALQALGLLEADNPEQRRALLVLDNFEHLREAASAVAQFLTRSSGPTLLVTSRIPLHVSMEAEYHLDPLPLPAAVELFLDRARAVSKATLPSAEVEEICTRLDGLPLALELAAARLKLLDPSALLRRLDSSLALLTHGPRDLPERQQTLEATIAWSYDLLGQDAQAVFTHLSVFAGTFDLEAAEAVADADLEAIANLVDASLLKPRGDNRFLMLETIRKFARERLTDRETARLTTEHARHYLALAENAAPNLTGESAESWLGALDADNGNLRKALDWFEVNSPQFVAPMTISLWRFWLVRGRYDEGQAAIERALRLAPSPTERAELLYELGALVISRGDTDQGRAFFLEALEAFRGLGLPHGEARSLGALGHAAADAGAAAEAIELYQAAAEAFRSIGDQFALGGVLSDLGTVHLRSGSPAEALPLAAESLAIQRQVGNRYGEALALAIEGYAEAGVGRLDKGQRLLVRSTEIAHRVGYMHGLVFSLNGLAAVAHRTGDDTRAARLFDAAKILRASMGIEYDPDEILVVDDRTALAERYPLDHPDEFDLDRVIALALDV